MPVTAALHLTQPSSLTPALASCAQWPPKIHRIWSLNISSGNKYKFSLPTHSLSSLHIYYFHWYLYPCDCLSLPLRAFLTCINTCISQTFFVYVYFFTYTVLACSLFVGHEEYLVLIFWIQLRACLFECPNFLQFHQKFVSGKISINTKISHSQWVWVRNSQYKLSVWVLRLLKDPAWKMSGSSGKIPKFRKSRNH